MKTKVILFLYIFFVQQFVVAQENKNPAFKNFPKYWEAVTTNKQGQKIIYEPCGYQNEAFVINQSIEDDYDVHGSIVKKGSWVMYYIVGQDGILYNQISIEKANKDVTLKAFNCYSSQWVVFTISQFDTQKQMAIWQWVDEKGIKQKFEMANIAGIKKLKHVKEICDE